MDQEQPPGGEEATEPSGKNLIKPVIPEDPASSLPPPTPTSPLPPASVPTPPVTVPPPQPIPSADNLPSAAPPKPAPQPAAPRPEGAKLSRHPRPVPGQPGNLSGSKEWEDQKVRQMALEMARNQREIRKLKICYSVKDNEWWIILYEDAGGFYELKQFVWDRDQDKLEAFLVQKKVPKSRLEEHLRQQEPDRACEALDPGPPGGQ